MEVIGFIALCVVMFYISFAWLVYALNTLGEHNIGGVPNTWGSRIICLSIGGLICYGWFAVFANAPFEIIINT